MIKLSQTAFLFSVALVISCANNTEKINTKTTEVVSVATTENSPEAVAKEHGIEIVKLQIGPNVGQIAPEIDLPTPEGKNVKLSSFRGKYVLVDFWASWCGPCRKENPNVVKLYEKYKGEKFEILGVSLDKKKEDWIKAIQKDQLTWVHVSDLKFWYSQAAEDYEVESIPATFLIDPNGVIIAKNLRGSSLEKQIGKLLGEGK
jgi:peroxiredoxin